MIVTSTTAYAANTPISPPPPWAQICPGAKAGDKVLRIQTIGGGDRASYFEDTISVDGEIQQTTQVGSSSNFGVLVILVR